jgi:hypothetical protein
VDGNWHHPRGMVGTPTPGTASPPHPPCTRGAGYGSGFQPGGKVLPQRGHDAAASSTSSPHQGKGTIEFTKAGGVSLRYANGQLIQNWKMRMTKDCYDVSLTLDDGSELVAHFRTKLLVSDRFIKWGGDSFPPRVVVGGPATGRVEITAPLTWK